MDLKEYIIAKTQLIGVKTWLEFRRDAIIQKKQNRPEVLADLTELIKMVEGPLIILIELESELKQTNVRNFKIRATNLELNTELKELRTLNERLQNGL